MSPSRITKKVGVFGGTFDPIHIGHVSVARAVFDAFDLDQVLFVVTADQWLRENPPLASASDRFKMVELALGNIPEFVASNIDIVRDGSTYTVDTLRDLHELFGDSVEFFLIVGADSAASMDRWKSAGQIARLAMIIAVGRPGQRFDAELFDESHPASGAAYFEGPRIDVSATLVRSRLRAGRSVSDLISETVAQYIETTALYR